MRIGVRVPRRSSGGGLAFYERLSPALRSAEEVTSLHLYRTGASDSPVGPNGEVTTSGGRLTRSVIHSRELERAVRRDAIDVLLCPGTEVDVIPGLPTVMWPLTVAPFEKAARRELSSSPRGRVKWLMLEKALRHSVRRSHGFVFSSFYACGLYSENAPGVQKVPWTVIPPAPTTTFDNSPVSPWESEAAPSKPYILFVSHLYPYKMVVELLRSFSLARSWGVSHDLVIAGGHVDPAYSQRVRNEISRLGLAPNVHLKGSVERQQLSLLYGAADAFVFPSLSENAGSYALIDAFRCGVPVFSSSVSSMPEACQGGASFFDPRRPEQLATQLAATMRDRSALRAMSEASKNRGAQYQNWDDIASSLVNFLQPFTER